MESATVTHCAVHSIPASSPTNAWKCLYKYVDQKGLAAILVVKRSVGVIPVVNLMNPLHAGDEAHKRRIHSGFETQARH